MQKQNLIAVPTGYMGSGSSAITDILSEIDGFEHNNGSYEYVLLHCPDGVFDLEDKLLAGNNALRSDEALHSFSACMEKLFRPGYWYTDYRRILSPDFLAYCREFIGALGVIPVDDIHWYYQDDTDTPGKKLRYYVRRILSIALRTRRLAGKPVRPLKYDDTLLAFPDGDTFYAAARAFLSRLFGALGYAQHSLVLDQLLLPHNLWRVDRYFGEELRVFVVDRDPRDTFLLNKYYWHKDDAAVALPLEAESFAAVYRQMRRAERPSDDPRILRLHFEDLVYRYDETLQRIYAFLDVDPARHTARKGSVFQPERSIHNTRLFAKDARYREESAILRARLEEYLYPFPEQTAEAWQADRVF